MRLHIVGHSNARTDDVGESGRQWPVRLRDGLAAELGEAVVLTGTRLAPYGPKAAGIGLADFEEARPDYVVVSLGTYLCTVGVVSLRVRQRFGRRAERLYQRAEQAFSKRTGNGGRLATALNRAARRTARRLVGTALTASPDEVIGVYETIVRGLAHHEGVQVVVMGEHYFSREQQRANPAMVATIERVHRVFKNLAEAHHFLWANVEETFQATGRRAEMTAADGVHNTPEGHQALADMLIGLIAAAERESRLLTMAGPR